MKFLRNFYTFVLRVETFYHYVAKMWLAFSAPNTKVYKTRDYTGQNFTGLSIFLIFLYFPTKRHSFTKLRILFPSALINFPISKVMENGLLIASNNIATTSPTFLPFSFCEFLPIMKIALRKYVVKTLTSLCLHRTYAQKLIMVSLLSLISQDRTRVCLLAKLIRTGRKLISKHVSAQIWQVTQVYLERTIVLPVVY